MAQTILSVVADVAPASRDVLQDLIAVLRRDEEAFSPQFPVMYDRLRSAIPSLHFMSITIFPDAQYEPLLVIECNFDGAAGPFFAQLEEAYGPLLRDMLRCCKVPPNPMSDMFANVVAAGSRAPVAPMLEALTVWPAVSHQGNRGMRRERIEREHALFKAVCRELDTDATYRGQDIMAIHQTLQARMVQRFDWLNTAEPALIPNTEDLADKCRLVGFLLMLGVALTVPGIVLSLMMPIWVSGSLLTIAMAWAAMKLDWLRELDRHTGQPVSQWLAATLLIPVVSFMLISILPSHEPWQLLRLALSGVSGIIPVILLLLFWLRLLEKRDTSLDAPVQDERVVQELAKHEDQVNQNHMISIVHLKPGALRATLIRLALCALNLVLRVLPASRQGYLASMRTIHFAHWAILSNGSRLMFHSNFDGTWESYLDDFIEKAHAGLTLAWCCGVGFPPTRFLVLDGATQGRRFKSWARHSMAASLFWFSAYHELPVNQIDRQRRLAEGLRKSNLTQQEAEAWALDL